MSTTVDSIFADEETLRMKREEECWLQLNRSTKHFEPGKNIDIFILGFLLFRLDN